MCQRITCQELQRRIEAVRTLAQSAISDPFTWATEIARAAARVLRHADEDDPVDEPTRG